MSVNQYFSPFASPYHRLHFSSGWQYVSPSIALPYPPSSPPNVAAFIPELQWPARMGWRNGEGTLDDKFLRATIASYPAHMAGKEKAPAFTAHSVNFGCAYPSPNQTAMGKPCVVTVRGESAESSLPSSASPIKSKVNNKKSMTFAVLPCPADAECALANFTFGDRLENVTELTFDARVDGRSVGWFMDDLAVSWEKRPDCHQ